MLIAVPFALMALTFVLGLIFISRDGSPPSIELAGIDVAELERCDNLKLLLPNGALRVSAEQAQATAEAGDPFDLPAQQTVLARLVRDGPPELVYRDNLVWVVVLGDGAVHELDGPGGPALQDDSARKPLPFIYELVLVDALTGEIALGRFGPENPAYVANICPP